MSNCPGRLGQIIDFVRDLSNEHDSGFISDEFIIRQVNNCIGEIAQYGYWRKYLTVEAAPLQAEIDLAIEAPEVIDVLHVFDGDTRTPLIRLDNSPEFEHARSRRTCTGSPRYYLNECGSIGFWPPFGITGGNLLLYCTYLPDELDCTSGNCNPRLPRPNDILFVYYVLRNVYLRDKQAPGSDIKVNEYSNLFELAKQKLLSQIHAPLKLKPYLSGNFGLKRSTALARW